MSRLLTLSRTLPRSPLHRLASTFQTHPSPPRLPADQQAEFERLQRVAAVSSAFHEPPTAPASSTTSSTANDAEQQPLSTSRHTTTPSATAQATANAQEESRDVNQGIFRGAPPEFQGDTNPKTGEVGGPKNEPLRWGSGGDWSYNGRVTDF